jgi:hypothetical protein
MSLQAVPIFRYSFYGFFYSLEFRGTRYHWYQLAPVSKELSICAESLR